MKNGVISISQMLIYSILLVLSFTQDEHSLQTSIQQKLPSQETSNLKEVPPKSKEINKKLNQEQNQPSKTSSDSIGKQKEKEIVQSQKDKERQQSAENNLKEEIAQKLDKPFKQNEHTEGSPESEQKSVKIDASKTINSPQTYQDQNSAFLLQQLDTQGQESHKKLPLDQNNPSQSSPPLEDIVTSDTSDKKQNNKFRVHDEPYQSQSTHKQMTDQQKQKYQEQRQKILVINRRQGQMKQKIKNQKPQQYTHTIDNNDIRKTEKKKVEEKMNVEKSSRGSRINGIGGKQFYFEIGENMTQFVFTPSVSQDMFVKMSIFSHQDETFSEIIDIDQDKPLLIDVLEDNSTIMAQGEFYFTGYVQFFCKAYIPYMIKFRNSGKTKLVSLKQPLMVQAMSIKDALLKQDMEAHGQKTKKLLKEVGQLTGNRKKTWMLEIKDMNEFNKRLQKYYVYEIIEMIFTASICFGQLRIIKKLFSSSEIV